MCLAVPGKIINLTNTSDPLARTGRIDFSGLIKEVNMAYVPEAVINDYVIVHAGFALSILDEVEAQETLQVFVAFQAEQAQ